MTKYKLSIFLLTVLLGFACNSNNTSSVKTGGSNSFKPKPKQIEIKLVGQWEGQGAREQLIREFVQEYNFLHQDLRVVLKFPSQIYGDRAGTNSRDLFNVKQLKAEKSEYDILMINNGSNPIIADEPDWPKKYLVDFSEIEEFRNTTAPGIITDSLKNVWHGVIPGPVIEGFYYALWCNNKVADKVGIKVKQMGMTIDDFIGYMEAVLRYNQTHKDDYIIPLFEAKDWKVLSNFFNQIYASKLNDKQEYFKDYPTEKKLEGWHQTLNVLEKLSAYGTINSKWDTMVWNNNFHLMLKEKILFFPNGSWMYNQWQSLRDDNLKNIMPTEFPSVTGQADVYPGGYQIMWAVPKNAPNKEEAIKFLLAMNTSKIAEKWVRYTKCPTGIKSKLASVSMGVDHFENFTYQIQEKYPNNRITFSAGQFIFGYEHRWNPNYAHDVLSGKLKADEAMQKIRGYLIEQKVRLKK